MSVCGVCGRRVVWAVTLQGRRMPLDPGRDPGGNVAVWRDPLGRLRVRQLRRGERPAGGESLSVPHFATCEPARRRVGRRPSR